MSANLSSSSERFARPGSRALSVLQQGIVLLFGVLVLYAAGFLPMNTAHNAAHDTRHTFAFPCH